jgi:hypothetical protein
MRPNTYNPDCDFDPDQRDLDASIEERNKTEPDATVRARAWLEANTPLRWVDEPDPECPDEPLEALSRRPQIYAERMAAFLESETPRIRAEAEAENALLKKKLEIAMQGLDEYASQSNWACSDPNAVEPYDQTWTGDKGEHSFNGYELARRIKAEIEEVK